MKHRVEKKKANRYLQDLTKERRREKSHHQRIYVIVFAAKITHIIKHGIEDSPLHGVLFPNG